MIRIWYLVPGMLHDTFLSHQQLRIFVSRFVLLQEVLRAVVRFSFERQDNGVLAMGPLLFAHSCRCLCRTCSSADSNQERTQ